MALVTTHYFSDVLGLSTAMTVLLPQRTTEQIGLTGRADDRPPPVLYLLHGASDDETIWLRRTSIERYAAERGLAVVMPRADLSFYSDGVAGPAYWTHLTEELPQIVSSFFRVSSAREDTFVAGLSMGGFGAVKWGLRAPQTFAAVASLSGVLDLPSLTGTPWRADLMARLFGGRDLRGTEEDTLHLLRRVDRTDLPALFVACGTEDHLWDTNERFLDLAAELDVPVTTHLGPGDHDWAYWDARIVDVLDWLPLRATPRRPT